MTGGAERTRQDERDRLAELIAAIEAENGPADPAAVAEKRAVFRAARAKQAR
ncbi:hypothetical protein [Spirillospora sp. CA-294931]|uniref:hypothetical protein n=1 Tax=Spirillospora sp. CA-294931 TaxID=3240042 RepID=UPI003D939D2B